MDNGERAGASELAAGWLGRLRSSLAGYARIALENIDREFPAYISSTMTAPGDFPYRPRDRNPVFYGSFDWHSCVEMFWLLVRLLKTAAGDVPDTKIRAALDARLTPGGLRAEADFMATPHGAAMERPYGWGWALALAAELDSWDDPDAVPLGRRPPPPGRCPRRQNFLRLASPGDLPAADRGAYQQFVRDIESAAVRGPAAGRRAQPGTAERSPTAGSARTQDYPGGWEPSGHDFLSPALCEAELMARLLPRADFPGWLARFLPGIAAREPAALFTPAVVTDSSDGQIAHLRGLNLSRAWCWRRLAETLSADDPRVDRLHARRRGARRRVPGVRDRRRLYGRALACGLRGAPVQLTLIRPVRVAIRSWRRLTPTLPKIALTWSRTVCSEMNSAAAMSSVDRPSITRRATSRSRGVSPQAFRSSGASSPAGAASRRRPCSRGRTLQPT